MLAALPPDPAVGVIILDACRDNPLARTLARALPVSRSTSVGAGLAPVQANGQSTNAGGLLIAYATDPGAVAYDGKDAHSPYTTALAQASRHARPRNPERADPRPRRSRAKPPTAPSAPGTTPRWRARCSSAATLQPRRQATATAGPPLAAGEPSRPAPSADWTVEQKLWDEASKRNTIAHYELYLSQYPEGRFASVARLNLDQLKETGATAGRCGRRPSRA